MDNTICNISAEQQVLSAIMLDNSAKDGLDLCLADFYREAHKVIYDAISDLWFLNKPIDVLTLADRLKDMKKLEAIGGLEYLIQLQGIAFTSANIKSHAEILRECAIKRELLRYTEEAKIKILNSEASMDEVLSSLQSEIMTLSMVRAKENETVSLGDVLKANIQDLKENAKQGFSGLETDFIDFDRMTGGLKKSNLIVLAARPAMGKTALALNIAQNVACNHNKSVLLFSLEMSKEELGKRILSSIAKVDGAKMYQAHKIVKNEWQSIVWAYDKHKTAPITISDTADVTPSAIRRIAKQVKYQSGLDLIVVDYLQLMNGDKKSDSRTQEISAISRSLKLLARELDIPVIALSQLSRGLESRLIKRPMLSDLRESGAIEQDADLVMFLYRDTYYNPDSEKTHTELIIAKHRHGPIGTVNLFFDQDYTTFRNLSNSEE